MPVFAPGGGGVYSTILRESHKKCDLIVKWQL